MIKKINTSLKIIIIGFCSLLLFNCSDPNKEVIQLEEEVIQIHDEVMPKSTEIHQLKKELKNKLPQVVDSTETLSIIKSLDDADEAMMVWMGQYKSPDLKASKEENIKYLNDQRLKMIVVKEKMLSAIKIAEMKLQKQEE